MRFFVLQNAFDTVSDDKFAKTQCLLTGLDTWRPDELALPPSRIKFWCIWVGTPALCTFCPR